ncbi:MAG: hypothetical protein IJ134_02045 [Bacilli bacterium]|nr:hypothetical protein [Bacilli bacterium]
MKNKTILVLVLVFLVTGCTVVRIDTSTIDNTINVVLSKKNNLYNRIGKGYKYYIPRGVSYIDTNEFNEELYSNGVYYYLYIDAVSYFHKKQLEYNIDKSAFYSKKIDINDKTGYLQITKKDEKYLVEFVYNYSKIESLVDKDKIEEVVLNSSYILSTVKFNDNVIKLMLDEEYFTNKEEKYDIFEKLGQNNGTTVLEDK